MVSFILFVWRNQLGLFLEGYFVPVSPTAPSAMGKFGSALKGRYDYFSQEWKSNKNAIRKGIKMSDFNWPWIGFIFGVLTVGACLYALPGGGSYRGFPYPPLGVKILFVVGLCIAILSLRALMRGEGKPRPYTEKDVEESRRQLERMYMKEHGAPPEYTDDPGKQE